MSDNSQKSLGSRMLHCYPNLVPQQDHWHLNFLYHNSDCHSSGINNYLMYSCQVLDKNVNKYQLQLQIINFFCQLILCNKPLSR